MIISRYLAKEVYSTLFATIFILLIIFISNQVVRYLQEAAAGELAGHAVALLLLLQLPHLLALLLPLSLFLAILLAYGRLYADNEMTIFSVCGISPWHIQKTTFKFSILIVFLVALLALWVEPQVSQYSDEILAGNTSSALDILMPNRFQTINHGKWVIYVDKTSRDKKQLNGIFAAEQEDADTPPTAAHPLHIIAAQGGHQMTDHQNNDNRYLVLTNGYRYEVVPGKKTLKITQYSDYGLKLQQPNTETWQTTEDNAPTSTLWQNRTDKLAATELQWRFSLPISALILTLLGTALSRIKPKRGRYAKLLPATICYIIYVQFLFLSRAWMKKGILAPLLGMWWVHLLMLVFAIALIVRQNTRGNKTSPNSLINPNIHPA